MDAEKRVADGASGCCTERGATRENYVPRREGAWPQVVLLSLVCFFETGVHTGLELTVYPKLAFNLQ